MLFCPWVYVLQQYGPRITAVHFVSCLVLFCSLKKKVGKIDVVAVFHLGWLNDHLFGKEMYSFGFLSVNVSFLNIYSYVSPSLPLGFEGGLWYFIVLVPDHCFFFLHFKDRFF